MLTFFCKILQHPKINPASTPGDFHYLEILPPRTKKKTPTKRCKYCKKTKIRKDPAKICWSLGMHLTLI